MYGTCEHRSHVPPTETVHRHYSNAAKDSVHVETVPTVLTAPLLDSNVVLQARVHRNALIYFRRDITVEHATSPVASTKTAVMAFALA